MPEHSGEVEVQDLADGLWMWRLRHPHWRQGLDWQSTVTSVCVESGGEVLLLDALLPPISSSNVWTRLHRNPPTVAVVLKPDHVRDVDFVVRFFATRALGPSLFWPDDVPQNQTGAH